MEIPEKNNKQSFHQGQIWLTFSLHFKKVLVGGIVNDFENV